MLALFLLLLTFDIDRTPIECPFPIAKVEKGYITNIKEICKQIEVDEQGNRSWEGMCYIPKDTPIKIWIKEENRYRIYYGPTLLMEKEENNTIYTYIGKTKKTLVVWCVLA